MVVTHGVAVGERAQVAGIAAVHVDEAHQLSTLAGVRSGDSRRIAPHACRDRDPRVQVERGVVATGLLPHLEEPVHRVSRRGGKCGCSAFQSRSGVSLRVGHVTRNLKRPIGQAAREAGIDAVSDVMEVLILNADQARRRQCPIRRCAWWIQHKVSLRDGFTLQGQRKPGTRVAIAIDDAFRKQVAYRSAGFREVAKSPSKVWFSPTMTMRFSMGVFGARCDVWPVGGTSAAHVSELAIYSPTATAIER